MPPRSHSVHLDTLEAWCTKAGSRRRSPRRPGRGASDAWMWSDCSGPRVRAVARHARELLGSSRPRRPGPTRIALPDPDHADPDRVVRAGSAARTEMSGLGAEDSLRRLAAELSGKRSLEALFEDVLDDAERMFEADHAAVGSAGPSRRQSADRIRRDDGTSPTTRSAEYSPPFRPTRPPRATRPRSPGPSASSRPSDPAFDARIREVYRGSAS